MPRLTNTAELKNALSKAWDDLPPEFIDKVIVSVNNIL